MSTSEVIGI